VRGRKEEQEGGAGQERKKNKKETLSNPHSCTILPASSVACIRSLDAPIEKKKREKGRGRGGRKSEKGEIYLVTKPPFSHHFAGEFGGLHQIAGRAARGAHAAVDQFFRRPSSH
jgi:hypothetical protein